MAKGADTWMAFYPGAYLANTLHLTRCQHGSYLLLILAAFKSGGVLPNNDAALAAIARCTPKEWQAERGIYAAFFEVTDDHWVHDRVTRELEKAERMTGQKRIAGMASAAARQRNSNGRSTAVDFPQQRLGKPSEPHPDNLPHGDISSDAVSASASPNGPPRPRLPDTAKWAERLDAFRPWLGERPWHASWGLPPDSSGRNGMIPAEMLRTWKATYTTEMAKQRSAA